jgi:hypothetical protein
VTTKHHPPVHQIEIRIAEISALFNSMDPTPFHERDLDHDAEEFIESWALEFPKDSHFRIIVHLEKYPEEDPTPVVATGIHNYFHYKSVLTRRRLRTLLLEGRKDLLIGVTFLLLCMFSAEMLASYEGNTVIKVVKESLLIGGWVAMWRPMQIFLYEWWPLLRRSSIYENLGHALVHVTQGKPTR